VHFGPVLAATFGIFLIPMEEAHGWSRSAISVGFSIVTLTIAIGQPIVGRLMDSNGAKSTILFSATLLGASIASLYFLTANIWHFYIMMMLIGIVACGTTPVSYTKVVSAWFDRRRGLALAIAIAGSSIGAAVFPPLAQGMIDGIGWRMAYVALGCIVVVVTWVFVGGLLKESPASHGLLPDGDLPEDEEGNAEETQTGFSRTLAFRTTNFWFLVFAFLCISVAFHACLIHLVPLLRDQGVDATTAANAAALMAMGIFVGRIVTGILLDKYFAARVAIAIFSLFTLAIRLLWFEGPVWLSFLAVTFLGVAQGAEFDLMAYMVGRYFGLLNFAAIYGVVFSAFTIGGAIGPPIMGFAYDTTGSYQAPLLLLAVLPVIAIVLMTRMGSYPEFPRPQMQVKVN